MSLTVQSIADALGAEYRGDGKRLISKLAPLDQADDTALSFLGSVKYRAYLQATHAGVVLLKPDQADDCPVSCILVKNPYLAYARAANLLYPPAPSVANIHSTAVIAADVSLGADVSIGPHVVLEAGVKIGDRCQIDAGCFIGAGSILGADCHIYPRVILYANCCLGRKVTIHSGSVIGSDGFGYAEDEQGAWVKIPQLGRVVIGDGCEIGANTTVDRGALQDTVLEEGVILDNQIQIAHNCHIGAHTAMAGCVGIAGSTRIGRYCRISGGVGFVGHLEIADRVIVTAMSMVTSSLTEAGSYSAGTPLEPSASWRRNQARFKQLDAMARRISALEKQLAEKNS